MKSMEWMNALTSQTSVDPMMVERYYKSRFDNNTIIALPYFPVIKRMCLYLHRKKTYA